MTQSALRTRSDTGDIVRCGWCREDAAVELEGRSYCGTCFLWIAVRKHPARSQLRTSVAPGYFARPNASSR